VKISVLFFKGDAPAVDDPSDKEVASVVSKKEHFKA